MILDRADAAHLLRRTGFGATLAEIDSYVGLTRAQAVARVLDLTHAPSTPRPAVSQTGEDWERHTNTITWWIERMVSSPTPIGSSVFAIPPGCDEGGYVGQTLLEN